MGSSGVLLWPADYIAYGEFSSLREQQLTSQDGLRYWIFFFFFFSPVALHTKSGLGRLTVGVSISHTTINTHPEGLLWRLIISSQRPPPTQHNQRNRQERQISIFTVGLELAVPAITLLQMYAVDRTAAAIEEWAELDGDIWPSGRLDGWVCMCRCVCLLMERW
jgi:hypothetical protein